MTVQPSHLVIGGGVIGLCTAYFLGKAGQRVTVIDRDPSGDTGCSQRNAGMVVPSHFTPLAAPGVVGQGLKWMLDRRSPFALRPGLNRSLWSWCWQFYRHANRRHALNSRELLRDLSLESRTLFEELAEELGFTFVRRGLLMLCESAAGLHEETEVAAEARSLGLEAEVCAPERLRELDPEVDLRVLGGVWFPRDAHLDPTAFLDALRRGILRQGGNIRSGKVMDFRKSGDSVVCALTAEGEELSAERFTLAAGIWSAPLARRLGLNLPMQAGKGYSFTLPQPTQQPELCYLLKEGRVAITPMGDKLRVAGTMEIGGSEGVINRRRLEGIITSFCRCFPAFKPGDFTGLEPWSGLRPCSPDGLPYIGRVRNLSNVVIAGGHAMLGLSLAPVTARLVVGLHAGAANVPRLDPARFGKTG
ncbi:MAG: FAD-dependent oxidoreductase [Verrucomicrobiales bacterium]|nr:FAD-dependent oxidoreductase [Verrucomicrobiales bacterium]